MSKNIKEKSSFWKKLGLGKHKASSASLSTAYQQQQEAPIKEAPIKEAPIKEAPIKEAPIKDQDTTPQIERRESEVQTEPLITTHGNIPKQQSNDKEHVNDKSVDESLPKINNDTLTPTEHTQNEQETRLQEEIDDLKTRLEKEKSVIDSLRKQKEAISKDLDYLGSTVDELYNEKSELLQQLEDERSKNKSQLEDLNVLMDKMKANADNARDKSFAVDHYKAEFENHMNECLVEKKVWNEKMASKDKEIKRLNINVQSANDQLDTLRLTMDQLIQSHAIELSRATTAAATAAAAAAAAERNLQSMNTPNGSPQFHPKQDDDLSCSPIPTRLPVPSNSTSSTQKSTESLDTSSKPTEDIDSQLMKLTKEKETLQSYYSKIPLTGGGPRFRRRKEELEAMLDQVDSQLSKVKQTIRRP